MMTVKQRPTIGDRLWRVEWCSALAFDECGDVDRDRCKESAKCFRTREAARAFGEKVWPKTREAFGLVSVVEIEFTAYDDDDAATMPHVGYWEDVSDAEVFSGEWE